MSVPPRTVIVLSAAMLCSTASVGLAHDSTAVATEQTTTQPAGGPTTDPASEAPESFNAATADTVFASLEGDWSGTLEYRDYQSDRRITLPVRLATDRSGVGPVLTQRIEFDDPGITYTSFAAWRFDDSFTSIVECPLDGNSTTDTHAIERVRIDDRADWEFVLRTTGRDDDRPADLRHTWTLSKGVLTVAKAVRYTDAADPNAARDATQDAAVPEDWQFRNIVRLERTKAGASAVTGVYAIDLRPSPDADPVPREMTLNANPDGTLTGVFYGTPFENGHWSGAWDAVRFSFATQDSSGPYLTSGTIKNGRASGMTHSVGRGFLSVWSGVRNARPTVLPD